MDYMKESVVIRELNKVSFSLSDTAEFEAYYKEGFNLGIRTKMEDMTSLSPNALTTLAVNAFGLTPAFDMPRWFAYKGTEPITMNVPCYLNL